MLRRALVPVTVRRLDRSATQWDPDFKVPAGHLVYGLPETVLAIVRWDQERVSASPTGQVVTRSGSFAVPADSPDPEFRPGDKVEAIGGRVLEPPAYIVAVRPSGLIGGRHRFIRYEFEARNEAV